MRRPTIFGSDSISLRSFRPSFERGRQPRTEHPQPTLKDLARPSFDEHDFCLSMGLPPSSTPQMPPQPASSRPPSKTRGFIRILTTKFSRSSSAPAPAERAAPPPPPPNSYLKEQRDAALRARGLLPPLHPSKDLSLQEAEQDLNIPVVRQSAESAESSEADRIKREWEAKNISVEQVQRERMTAFKFGGNSPAPSPTVSSFPKLDDSRPSTDATADSSNAQRPTTPLIDLTPGIEAFMFPLPLSASPSQVHLDSSDTSSSALLEIPNEKNADLSRSPSSISTVMDAQSGSPRPPTPTVQTAPVISLTPPQILSQPVSTATLTDSATPPVADPVSSAESSPVDAPATPVFPTPVAAPELEASTVALPTAESAPSDDVPLLAPSLSSDSEATTNTDISIPIPRLTPIGKLGGLVVKTNEVAMGVPVIIETSPIAEGGIEESGFAPVRESLDVVVEAPEKPEAETGGEKGLPEDLNAVDDKAKFISAMRSASPEPLTPSSPGPAALAPPSSPGLPQSPPSPGRSPRSPTFSRTQRRGQTTDAKADKRKSIFQRAATILGPKENTNDSGNTKTDTKAKRRSIIGSLSKTKTQPDWSQLPNSPTLPSAFAADKASLGGSVRTGSSTQNGGAPRVARAPTMYNRGSILIETSEIEDEETRKLTELAFLG